LADPLLAELAGVPDFAAPELLSDFSDFALPELVVASVPDEVVSFFAPLPSALRRESVR
jgi:hypothetical protein